MHCALTSARIVRTAPSLAGKYYHEVKLAVPHAAAMLCANASWRRADPASRHNAYHGVSIGLTLTLPPHHAPSATLFGARYRASARWVRLADDAPQATNATPAAGNGTRATSAAEELTLTARGAAGHEIGSPEREHGWACAP